MPSLTLRHAFLALGKKQMEKQKLENKRAVGEAEEADHCQQSVTTCWLTAVQ